MNMKKLLSIIIVSLICCNNSFSDPIIYKDDWNTLDSLKVNKLSYKNSSKKINLSVENKNLILRFNDNESNIYKFNDSNFDVYLTVKKNIPHIYIFNHNTKKLLVSSINNNNVKFKKIEWNFGTLMAIFADCKKIKTTTEVYNDQIKNNYFLTKFSFKERPKKFKCSYLIFGGRCSLIFNESTNEYGVGDKMIVSDTLDYKGDFDDMRDIVGAENGINCRLYKKISI